VELQSRYLEDFFNGNGTSNLAFDGLGDLNQNCFQTQAIQPEQSLQLFHRDPMIKGLWELRINDAFIGNIGTFNSWELELCVVKDICGPLQSSTETPIAIGPNLSSINIPDIGTVSQVSISNLNIAHENSGDLRIILESPLGKTAVLANQICGANMVYNMVFNDDASSTLDYDFIFGAISKSKQSLTIFSNQKVQGEWRLIV
jgi:subtilisin-like proprotein convertase family protein